MSKFEFSEICGENITLLSNRHCAKWEPKHSGGWMYSACALEAGYTNVVRINGSGHSVIAIVQEDPNKSRHIPSFSPLNHIRVHKSSCTIPVKLKGNGLEGEKCCSGGGTFEYFYGSNQIPTDPANADIKDKIVGSVDTSRYRSTVSSVHDGQQYKASLVKDKRVWIAVNIEFGDINVETYLEGPDKSPRQFSKKHGTNIRTTENNTKAMSIAKNPAALCFLQDRITTRESITLKCSPIGIGEAIPSRYHMKIQVYNKPPEKLLKTHRQVFDTNIPDKSTALDLPVTALELFEKEDCAGNITIHLLDENMIQYTSAKNKTNKQFLNLDSTNGFWISFELYRTSITVLERKTPVPRLPESSVKVRAPEVVSTNRKPQVDMPLPSIPDSSSAIRESIEDKTSNTATYENDLQISKSKTTVSSKFSKFSMGTKDNVNLQEQFKSRNETENEPDQAICIKKMSKAECVPYVKDNSSEFGGKINAGFDEFDGFIRDPSNVHAENSMDPLISMNNRKEPLPQTSKPYNSITEVKRLAQSADRESKVNNIERQRTKTSISNPAKHENTGVKFVQPSTNVPSQTNRDPACDIFATPSINVNKYSKHVCPCVEKCSLNNVSNRLERLEKRFDEASLHDFHSTKGVSLPSAAAFSSMGSSHSNKSGILHGDSSPTLDVKKVKANWVRLVKDMRADNLCDYFYQNDILHENDMTNILGLYKTSPQEANRRLLDILIKKQVPQKQLVEILDKAEESHLIPYFFPD